MKRSVVMFIVVGLLILGITGSIFAFPGPNKPLSKAQQQGQPQPMAPGRAGGMGMGFMGPMSNNGIPGRGLANPELRDAQLKLMIANALNAMGLERSQIEEIYNVVKKAKEDLKEIDNKILEEYQNALEAIVKKDDEELQKAQDKIKSLIEEKRELKDEVLSKIKSKITVEQFEKLMEYFKQEIKSRFENAKQDIKSKFENAKENLDNFTQGAREKLSKFKELYQERYQEMLEKLRDSVTDIFENKLFNILLSDQFAEVLELYLQ